MRGRRDDSSITVAKWPIKSLSLFSESTHSLLDMNVERVVNEVTCHGSLEEVYFEAFRIKWRVIV